VASAWRDRGDIKRSFEVLSEALGLAVVSTYFPRLKAAEPGSATAAALFGTFARLLAVLAIPASAGLAILGRPLLAVLFGSVQTERAILTDVLNPLPKVFTLDNFRLVLSGGRQTGQIFDQAPGVGAVYRLFQHFPAVGSGGFVLWC